MCFGRFGLLLRVLDTRLAVTAEDRFLGGYPAACRCWRSITRRSTSLVVSFLRALGVPWSVRPAAPRVPRSPPHTSVAPCHLTLRSTDRLHACICAHSMCFGRFALLLLVSPPPLLASGSARCAASSAPHIRLSFLHGAIYDHTFIVRRSPPR